MTRYGIKDEEWGLLQEVLARFPHIERAVLFGSRAKGTSKPFSDVDIALVGQGVTLDDVLGLKDEVDDLLLPYEFDFCIYDRLRNADLCDHITRCGVEIYPTFGIPFSSQSQGI